MRIGEIVKLKSGGPVMTVSGSAPRQTKDNHDGSYTIFFGVECSWFEGNELRKEVFFQEELARVNGQ